jgi:hypothetical protein
MEGDDARDAARYGLVPGVRYAGVGLAWQQERFWRKRRDEFAANCFQIEKPEIAEDSVSQCVL